ncbi:vacuole membrane protein 1 homolog isoform X2 [Schistocerca gregaria]|uniref:vacuole membrane protein 1 homolog isoform X2 n=1 Tax=Schistocerca gregaria TaxID=7010 RepID=UPI00211F2A92|nr:vacuole membrane protein 1 homolog isoform X2 [Schistocerca gregaria]
MRENLKHRHVRRTLTLFRHPVDTLYYLSIILRGHVQWLATQMQHHKKKLLLILVLICSFFTGIYTNWTYQLHFRTAWTALRILTWWVFLGFLSSFGVGTGLHTFVLYLGPFIARTTLAATECQSVIFDRYGPDAFTCTTRGAEAPSFFSIWSMVIFEAFFWGLGTVIGELPPYFIARASKMAQDRLRETEDSIEGPHGPPSKDDSAPSLKPGASLLSGPLDALRGRYSKLRQYATSRLKKIGFWGILLFASVPNPFFDLAGLTCGHMLIPFRVFFFATFLGKAVIKMSIQTVFVIVVFDMNRLTSLVRLVDRSAPCVGGRVRAAFDQFREQYYQPQSGDGALKKTVQASSGGRFKLVWSVFIWVTIMYFLTSTINSTVQEYLAKQDEEKRILKTNPENKRQK